MMKVDAKTVNHQYIGKREREREREEIIAITIA